MEFEVLELNYKKDLFSEIKEKINFSEKSTIIDFKGSNFLELINLEKEITNENIIIVFIYDKISEDLHDKLNTPLVPTIEEAKDFIEMELIQKELDI